MNPFDCEYVKKAIANGIAEDIAKTFMCDPMDDEPCPACVKHWSPKEDNDKND